MLHDQQQGFITANLERSSFALQDMAIEGKRPNGLDHATDGRFIPSTRRGLLQQAGSFSMLSL